MGKILIYQIATMVFLILKKQQLVPKHRQVAKQHLNPLIRGQHYQAALAGVVYHILNAVQLGHSLQFSVFRQK